MGENWIDFVQLYRCVFVCKCENTKMKFQIQKWREQKKIYTCELSEWQRNIKKNENNVYIIYQNQTKK